MKATRFVCGAISLSIPHAPDIAAMDLFIVPTIGFNLGSVQSFSQCAGRPAMSNRCKSDV
jgi:hypothetical protein